MFSSELQFSPAYLADFTPGSPPRESIKRPVSSEQIENAIQNIKDYIRKIGEREIPSQIIGKQVMSQLKELDQVAYVRYASVYEDFQDIKDFADEVSELSKK